MSFGRLSARLEECPEIVATAAAAAVTPFIFIIILENVRALVVLL
jgi:hypothetical protein